MQLGVFVDGSIDLHQQTLGLKVGKMLLKIETRPSCGLRF
jgi:hypothetical protein